MPTNTPQGDNQQTRRNRDTTGNKTQRPGSSDTGKSGTRRTTGTNEKNR